MKHYVLWTKITDRSTIFQIFECSNEGWPNSSCDVWNHKVKVYLNFASLFSVMKITPLYFCSWNLVYFGQKESIEKKFSDFWAVGWKFTKFLLSYLKPQVSFSLKFTSFFSVTRNNSSVLYPWDKRNLSKCKISDFWLLM